MWFLCVCIYILYYFKNVYEYVWICVSVYRCVMSTIIIATNITILRPHFTWKGVAILGCPVDPSISVSSQWDLYHSSRIYTCIYIYIIYTHGSYQHHWHHELSLSSSQVRQPNPIKVKMWTMKNCFRQPSPTHNSLRWTWINCWVASVKWRSNAPTLSERPFLGVSGSF